MRVDNAPGFRGLENDDILQRQGVSLDFRRVKNPSKVAVADRGIKEFEDELLRVALGVRQIYPEVLTAVLTLNQRIRSCGKSALEILLQRDQLTGNRFSELQVSQADSTLAATASTFKLKKNREKTFSSCHLVG